MTIEERIALLEKETVALKGAVVSQQKLIVALVENIKSAEIVNAKLTTDLEEMVDMYSAINDKLQKIIDEQRGGDDWKT